MSGEGESPLGRAAWGGPRAWRAREGLRGAWIEKAQSGLALRGSALGLARDKTYAATLTASEDSVGCLEVHRPETGTQAHA